MKEGKRGSAYAGLRKLGQKPGEISKTGFQLPYFTEQNLSNLECAEMMANYFSTVSQEYTPSNLKNLPPYVQEYLGNPDLNISPILSHEDVWRKLRTDQGHLISMKELNTFYPLRTIFYSII